METKKPDIVLRAMEPADIDAIYRWENDPEVWIYSAAHQPFSRHALQQFIDECSGVDIYASRQLRLMAENAEGEAVGCVDLYDFDPHHRRAGVGILTDSRMRRKGYGIAMLAAVEAFAREHIGLHQLYAIVGTGNEQSVRLFEKAGYATCGRVKDWLLTGGEWSDAIVYQKIIED